MSITFSGGELLDIAIGIEERGVTFYDAMTRAHKGEAQTIFQRLANAEREHARIFQEMFKEAGEYLPPENCTEEYQTYFKALVDNVVFNEDFINRGMGTCADNISKALDMGIAAEKDSILFYYGMREVTIKKAHSILDKIISEEKSHLRDLYQLKRR